MVSTRRRDQQPLQDRKQHLPKIAVGDRFLTTYDPSKALEIVEKLAEGLTLNAICTGIPGMPAVRTFRRWVVNNADLAKAYSAAITLSAQSLEEEALDTARQIAHKPMDGTHVRAAEVKLGQLRWSAERRDAAKYGTKTQLNLKVPVQIITSLNLNDKGDTLPAESIYTLDLTARTTALVDERPIVPEGRSVGPRKRVLTPRIPNPFQKALTNEDAHVRPEGNQRHNPQVPDTQGPLLDRSEQRQTLSQQEAPLPQGEGEVK